jgi:ribosomal protein S18 acetylase RimI-like enzyme
MTSPHPSDGARLVRDLGPSDLRSISQIHMAAFDQSALSKLGLRAVCLYYRWQLEGPHDVDAVGIVAGEELVGYGIGGVFRGAMSGYLRKNRRFLIGRALRHPSVLFGHSALARVRTAFKRRSGGGRPPAGPRSFGVLAVATLPSQQHAGVGALVMSALESKARERGFGHMHLSVQPSNLQAVRFYEELGWSRVAPGSAWRGVMEKSVADE